MVGRDSVDDQVEAGRVVLQAVRVGRHQEAVGPDLPGGGLLVGGGGDGRDGVAHGLGDLDPHLAETTDADHPDPHPSLVGPVSDEGSEHGDPGTEDRASSLQRVAVRDLHYEPADKELQPRPQWRPWSHLSGTVWWAE